MGIVNLAEAIKIIRIKIASLEAEKKREIAKIEEKYSKLIREYQIALTTLEELNQACPACGGTGSERYIDASGNYDTRDCPKCNGSGVR